MFRKLTIGWQLIALLSPIVLLALIIIGFDRLDPAYRTHEEIPAYVINRVYMTGKSGTKLKITIETITGKKHHFTDITGKSYRIGDQVMLTKYKRQYSGLSSYRRK